MDKAFIQKLTWTVLAIGVYVLTVFVPDVASDLKLIAGAIVGAVWVARPGDAKLIEVGRKSIAPAALLVLPLLWSCAGTSDAREALEGAKRAQESLEHVCAEIERTKALREGVTNALDDVAGVAPAGVDGGAPAEAAPVQQPEAAPVTR